MMHIENYNMLDLNFFDKYINNEEYDFEIMIAIDGAHVKERMPYFKKYGLLNSSNYKIHLTIVCSPGETTQFTDWNKNWNQNYDITVLESKYKQSMPKVNGYYFWLKNNFIKAKWYFRLDTDSSTDIFRLDCILKNYENSLIYLMQNLGDNVSKKVVFQEFIKKYEINVDVSHEREFAIVSNEAFCEIMKCKKACWFLKKVVYEISQFPENSQPGDQCFAVSASLAKIPKTKLTYTSCEFEFENFSIAGGSFCHIHRIPWNNFNFVQMLDAFVYGKFFKKIPDITNKDLEFGKCIGLPIKYIRLKKNGKIDGFNGSWIKQSNAILLIFDVETILFNKIILNGNLNFVIGISLNNFNDRYYLKYVN